jgi:hypothetical protein
LYEVTRADDFERAVELAHRAVSPSCGVWRTTIVAFTYFRARRYPEDWPQGLTAEFLRRGLDVRRDQLILSGCRWRLVDR